VPTFVRIASHVAVWTALGVSVAIVLSKGWVAVGDDGAIAIHAYQTFSLHPPLVGVYSTAANAGHTLFDPGPLLFWLMAVPVHIDPSHGLVWGSALAWGAALSLAIEAAWWKGAWLGCAVVAFTAVDLLCLFPELFENLVWNAYFPIPFLVASIVVAWVVATGSVGWWPVLVVAASIGAQSHLLFAIPSMALALVAPVVGLVLGGRPERLRWLSVGIVVGVACWVAPVVQAFGRNGNLEALARNGSGNKALGIVFGLRTIATATTPWPIWLRSEPSNFFVAASSVAGHSPLPGAIVLVLLAAVATVGWRRGHPQLAALAAMALVCAVGVFATFALYPEKNLFNLGYLVIILWVVGILCWTVGAWAAAVTLAAILRRRATVDVPARSSEASVLAGLGGIAIVAVFALAGLTSLATFVPNTGTVGADEAGMTLVGTVATQIEHRTPKGPVAISVSVRTSDVFSNLWMTEGVAWRLEADGWTPGLYGVTRSFTGLVPAPSSPAYVVTVADERLVSVAPAHCAALPLGCRATLAPSAR
jgi:hypothetical protein